MIFKDNGIGIDLKNRTKILDFISVSIIIQTWSYLVKSQVETMGTIEIDSEVNIGTFINI
jgi:hypothetical protein